MADASSAMPPSGLLAQGEHLFQLRVYYEDTDAAGIVYYANYLKFAERARTELLRLLGIQQRALATDHRLGFVARRCVVDYLRPAFLDDALLVRSRVQEMRGATLALAQAVWRGQEELARLALVIACVGSHGRPVRLPPALRLAFAALDGRAKPQ
jgi:acyl-CoA thioester hydrolase